MSHFGPPGQAPLENVTLTFSLTTSCDARLSAAEKPRPH